MSEPATREDLQLMTESIRRDLQKTEERILRTTREDLHRTADGILNLIGALTERIDHRFDAVDRRLQAMENRMDRFGETNSGLVYQFAGFTRWAEQLDKHNAQILAIQQAQQNFIDLLAARVTKLEPPRPPQQPPPPQ